MLDFERMKMDHQIEMDQMTMQNDVQRSAFEAVTSARLKERQVEAQAEAAMVSAKSKGNGNAKEK